MAGRQRRTVGSGQTGIGRGPRGIREVPERVYFVGRGRGAHPCQAAVMTPAPYRIVVRSKAQVDIEEAAEWYCRQDPTLASEFLVEVRSTIARAGENPYLHHRLRRR